MSYYRDFIYTNSDYIWIVRRLGQLQTVDLKLVYYTILHII